MSEIAVAKGSKDMNCLESCAKELAVHRAQLAQAVAQADEELRRVKDTWCEPLKKYSAKVAELEDELLEMVEDCPDLFDKPQSQEFDGVRFGWRKGKGTIVLPKAGAALKKLIGRIRLKLKKAQRDAVLKVEVKVLKGPLARLDGDTLKKLGVKIEGADLAPFVSYPESDIEKSVAFWKKLAGAAADEAED